MRSNNFDKIGRLEIGRYDPTSSSSTPAFLEGVMIDERTSELGWKFARH
jgi:hypothetical protein